MFAIAGFLIFLGASVLAYRAESYGVHEKLAEIVAGLLMLAGLSLIGLSLQLALNVPLAR
ncbi:MAG TPA: hypothetical protein VHD14_03100 [Pseudolabrys sp.]|nr:hypothetical protein [Pseudolabrys sp.]